MLTSTLKDSLVSSTSPAYNLERTSGFREDARLLPGRKHLKDTIGMIAYRSGTAMAGMVRENYANSSDARRLLQDLFVTEAVFCRKWLTYPFVKRINKGVIYV